MGTNDPPDNTLRLPRLLCLHGGGTTADIFRSQCRTLLSILSPHFRLVFVDAPFFCAPGPGMVPVYEAWGPFRRWLRWLPEHPDVHSEDATGEVFYSLHTAMAADEGSGEWEGILGFSQGSKVGASLLFEQQMRFDGARGKEEENGEQPEEEDPWKINGREVRFKFGVLCAGRAPLISLSERTASVRSMISAGEISEGLDFNKMPLQEVKLSIPTVHVHGTQDPGLHLHRILMDRYCEEESVTLVQWDGGHRMPLKRTDADKLAQAVLKVARSQGVEV